MPCVSLKHLYHFRRLQALRRAVLGAMRSPAAAVSAPAPQDQAPAVSVSSAAAPQLDQGTTHLASLEPELWPEGDVIQLRVHRPLLPPSPASAPVSPWRNFWQRPAHADFLNAESQYGRQLFGPIPAGHQREFFHDHDNIWIWHEAWQDHGRQSHALTVRYEVRPSGVYKKVAAGDYVALEAAELNNFRTAAHAYLYLIKQQLYSFAV